MQIIVGLVVLFIGVVLYTIFLYFIGRLSYKLFPKFIFANDDAVDFVINGMWCIVIILCVLLCVAVGFMIGSIILSQI